ncbi:uncharacterized protein MONBRDRAFT_33233 [Monosiga brevicollis MX1]|uniref:CCHC-type domain-containing protein n=1 Tax=Monosiga brevicollis TaxID=81824 RepID=A9V4A3_MONBE|nr:uncharacterized protein MONBRDRAFT_33233 [Monosiga brevicollis MX1]EDQ87673.1 predicted protein [Monosiga brevicollis MX1]|eukprot:XP_001747593.1 hypothetical protein [Monosiga brevicollis MX1]
MDFDVGFDGALDTHLLASAPWHWGQSLDASPSSSPVGFRGTGDAVHEELRPGHRLVAQSGIHYQVIRARAEDGFKLLRESTDEMCFGHLLIGAPENCAWTVGLQIRNQRSAPEAPDHVILPSDLCITHGAIMVVYDGVARAEPVLKCFATQQDEDTRLLLLIQCLIATVAAEPYARCFLGLSGCILGPKARVVALPSYGFATDGKAAADDTAWLLQALRDLGLDGSRLPEVTRLQTALATHKHLSLVARMPWVQALTEAWDTALLQDGVASGCGDVTSPHNRLSPCLGLHSAMAEPASPPRRDGSSRFVPRALCKFSRRGIICRTPGCTFLHLPGLKVADAQLAQLPPLPSPPEGYQCHNCGSNEHYRQDCPQPQRCKYTSDGGCCTRPHCAFFHPAGTRREPSLAEVSHHTPPPGFCLLATPDVCYNCMDKSRSHFKLNCPHPSRCPRTMRGDGVCATTGCKLYHPVHQVRPRPLQRVGSANESQLRGLHVLAPGVCHLSRTATWF